MADRFLMAARRIVNECEVAPAEYSCGQLETWFAEALREERRRTIQECANIGSKAAWMHFHFGNGDPNKPEKPSGHVCIRSDWSYADHVEKAIRALDDTLEPVAKQS